MKTKCSGPTTSGTVYPTLELAKAHCDKTPGCWAVHQDQCQKTKKFYLCLATTTEGKSTGAGKGVHSDCIYLRGKYF